MNRTTLPYRHEIAGCLASADNPDGLTEASHRRHLEAAATALSAIVADLAQGAQPALALSYETSDLAALTDVATRLADACDDVVVLGTGGSCSGARALSGLADPTGLRVHYPDSLDPATWARLTGVLDPARSGLMIVSKSGTTADTLAQALALLPWVRTAGPDGLGRRLVAISDPGDNALRRLAAREAFTCLDHPPAVGGRFAILSLVGLLPALLDGLDVAAVRRGAAAVLDQARQAAQPEGDPTSVPAVQGAALAAGLAERGISQTVLMPYGDRLAGFGQWHRQLWAESLGKKGRGTTPILGLGAPDQHSQLQLYLDGPSDKLFTLLAADTTGAGPRVPQGDSPRDPATDFLAGHTLGDLLMVQARATVETLAKKGRPVRQIRLDRLDETGLGALVMHFLLETLLTAALWGVDPEGQPAVEEGKRLARRYLTEGLL